MQNLPEPDLLVDMKFVRDNPQDEPYPEQARLKPMRREYRENYGGFLNQLIGLERAYLQANTRHKEMLGEREKQARLQPHPVAPAPVTAPSSWDGKGPCPVCKHEAGPKLGDSECVAKVEKWLKEQTSEPK